MTSKSSIHMQQALICDYIIRTAPHFTHLDGVPVVVLREVHIAYSKGIAIGIEYVLRSIRLGA